MSNQLQKAYLEVENGSRIECMFNPAKFEFSTTNKWDSDRLPGKNTPTLRYGGGQGGSFSLSLTFDTTSDGSAVTVHTNKLLKLMDIDESLAGYDATINNGRPPWVKFHWGTHLHSFKAVIKSATVGFTYFSNEGLPLPRQRQPQPGAVRTRRQLGSTEPDLWHAQAESHPPGERRRDARSDRRQVLRRRHQVARHRRRQRHRRPARSPARPTAGDPGAQPMSNSDLGSTPVLTIKRDGSNISEAALYALRRVEAEASAGATGWCRLEFVVDHTPSRQDAGLERFEVGSKITVVATVGSISSTVFEGEVVAIGTEIDLYGQQTVIDAFDGAYKLGPQVRIRTFVKQSDSDILKTIAGECGLSAKIASSVSTSAVEHRFQNSTNQELVEEICRRSGHSWKVVDGGLHVTQGSTGSAVTDLAWGQDLIRLSARYSTADHADSVTVRGWDPSSKASVEGRDNTLKTKFDSTADITAGHSKVIGGRTATTVRTVVESQAEANALAKGIARKMAATALSGDGEAIGNPKIVAGCKVKLSDITDTRWNGEYWVTSARHVWSEGQYVTQFQFGPIEPMSLVDVFGTTRSHAGAASGFGAGVTIGLVTNNKDDDNKGRIKVKYPYLSDQLESGWIRLASHGAGANRGILFMPEVNDEVVVAFEHGDIRRPYVLGSLWNGKDALPITTAVDGGKVKERVIYSRVGHKIRMSDDDAPDTNFVSIELKDGKTKAHFAESKIEIIANKKTLELKSGDGSILIDGASGDITIKGNNIKIDATGKVDVAAKTNVEIKATASAKISGQAPSEFKSAAPLKVESSAILELKGAVVKVN